MKHLICTLIGLAIIPAAIGFYYLYGGRGPLEAVPLAALTIFLGVIGFGIDVAIAKESEQ